MRCASARARSHTGQVRTCESTAVDSSASRAPRTSTGDHVADMPDGIICGDVNDRLPLFRPAGRSADLYAGDRAHLHANSAPSLPRASLRLLQPTAHPRLDHSQGLTQRLSNLALRWSDLRHLDRFPLRRRLSQRQTNVSRNAPRPKIVLDIPAPTPCQLPPRVPALVLRCRLPADAVDGDDLVNRQIRYLYKSRLCRRSSQRRGGRMRQQTMGSRAPRRRKREISLPNGSGSRRRRSKTAGTLEFQKGTQRHGIDGRRHRASPCNG